LCRPWQGSPSFMVLSQGAGRCAPYALGFIMSALRAGRMARGEVTTIQKISLSDAMRHMSRLFMAMIKPGIGLDSLIDNGSLLRTLPARISHQVALREAERACGYKARAEKRA